MVDPAVRTRSRAPLPLLVAAGLAALEGLALLGYGVAEAFFVQGGREVMGATTALFFAAFGALLVFAAYCLARLLGWARGPVLVAQVIQVGLAWNLRDGSTRPVSVVLFVAAVVALVGVLNRRSIEALDRES